MNPLQDLLKSATYRVWTAG